MTINNFKVGTEGLKLIKAFESCKLTAYYDSVGILTIGWGHTGPDVYDGLVITQGKADELLAKDLNFFENKVNKLVNTVLTQNQFDALVAIVFNIGDGAFAKSTLLKKINTKQPDAAEQFLVWNKGRVKGKLQVIDGLTRRRYAERELFLSGDWKVFLDKNWRDNIPNKKVN